MSMTPFVLTNDFSMRNLKKAEKSDFALRYLWIANKYKKATSGGEDMPSVQSGELAIPDLNVPQEVYDELVDAHRKCMTNWLMPWMLCRMRRRKVRLKRKR